MRRTRIAGVLLAATMVATVATAQSASGAEFGPGDHVRLCHALGGGAFISVTVPAQIAFKHAGGSHQSGADIIPPLTFEDNQGDVDTSLAGGQNWDSAGQATWGNNCMPPPPPPPPPPAPPPPPPPPAAEPSALPPAVEPPAATLPPVGGVAGGEFSLPVACGSITLGTKNLRAGKRAVLRIVVRDRSGRPLPGWRVTVRGAGIRVSAKTGAQGIARIVLEPKSKGILHIDAGRGPCSKRLSVLGVPFQPPITG